MKCALKKLVAIASAAAVFAVIFALAYQTSNRQMGEYFPGLVGSILLAYLTYALLSWVFFRMRRPNPEVDAAKPADGEAKPADEEAIPPSAGSEQQTDWLSLIRGLAAALVFVMHSGSVVYERDYTLGGSPLAWLAFSPAWLGMILFFSLSGYLMGKGFFVGKYTSDFRGARRFVANRALRIVPLTLVVALFIAVWQEPDWLDRQDLAARIGLFAFNGFDSPLGLSAYWSLSTEWHFYLLVPVLFVVVASIPRLDKPLVLSLVTILVVAVGTAIRVHIWFTNGENLTSWNPYMYTPVYGNIDVFVLGFLANWWLKLASQRRVRLPRHLWAPLLVIVYVVYSWFAFGTWVDDTIMPLEPVQFAFIFAVVLPGLTSLATIAVLVGAEQSNGHWAAKPQTRWKRVVSFACFWIGSLTFPVYLTHSSIMSSVAEGFGAWPEIARLGAAIVLTVVVSFILHVTVERTALRWRMSLTGSTSQKPSRQP